MDHSACPEKNCQWERYHADILMMNSCDKYMDTSIGNVNIGTSTQTRLTAQTELAIADGTELVKENLQTLAWRLHHDLSCEIFDGDTEIVIENCRFVSDLKAMLSKIKEKGSVLVGLEESRKFIAAARDITGTIASVSDDDLTKLYREFVVRNPFRQTSWKLVRLFEIRQQKVNSTYFGKRYVQPFR